MLTSIAIAFFFFALGLVFGNNNARRSVFNVVRSGVNFVVPEVRDSGVQSLGNLELNAPEQWAVEAAGWYLMKDGTCLTNVYLDAWTIMEMQDTEEAMPTNAGFKIEASFGGIGYVVERHALAIAA
jgi:hypothetical protein